MNALLVLTALLAATPITLEESRSLGRKNTQALQATLDVTVAEQDQRVARSNLLPQVQLNAGPNLSYQGRRRQVVTIPVSETEVLTREVVSSANTSDSYGASLGLSQVIYNRGLWKQLEQAGVSVDAVRNQALEEADTSELEAIRRFFTLFLSQATLDVLQVTAQRSEEQLERARALFQAGRVGKTEEISAEVNLGNDRINVVQRQSQLVADQVQLAVWLSRPGTESLQAVDPGILQQEPAPAPALDDALKQAREHRALLRALQQRVRVAELQRAIVQGDYLPRVGLQAQYAHGNQDLGPFFSEPGFGNTFNGGVTLTWDLFNGFNTDAQSARAQANIRRAELTFAQTARELEAEVRRAHQALDGQIASAKLATANRAAATQGLQLAEERFRAGAGSTLEVRDAQLKLTQAELVLLQSRIDVEIARYALYRATGTLNPGDSQ
ncbi:TolC family protein [Corallococcus llansteffanensis]|uniref:TolC family protein n=1 Tax=Corallococcus llansteffanensis TaxID=2316731 RepID=A0A3A8QBA7_9BACT|nr:TolC family protein [Corallococcus llansteffanensis]RKH60534.1 TolC family protein [Corallococcus llansteffanensis]